MDKKSIRYLLVCDLNESSIKDIRVFTSQNTTCPLFYHPSFISAYIKNNNGKIKLAKLLDNEGNVLAYLPGIEKPKHRFDNLTVKGWDHLSIPALSEREESMLIELLCNKYNIITLFSFRYIPKSIHNQYLAYRTDGHKCPYIELPSDFEVFFASLSKSFRKTVLRKIKKFEAESGEVIWVDETSSQKDIDQSFEELWHLHELRANESGITSQFTEQRSKSFHKALLRNVVKFKDISILFVKLKLKNKIIGIYYAFIDNNTFYYYNSGIHPEFYSFSPGIILMAASIKWAINKSLKNFDLLRGTESYKFHWTDSVSSDNNFYLSRPGLCRSYAFFEFLNDQRNRFGYKKAIMKMIKNEL